MFSSIVVVADTHLKHLRGRKNLKEYTQSKTVETGVNMSNYFCATCGSLMYRISERMPGVSLLRLGTVDDFSLHETKLMPKTEIFTKDRVSWCKALEGAVQFKGNSSVAQAML
ncbi:uncharacterized protein ColSpa_08931 [Colletotrichum spaethianum]|uniref:CENP-V/GFA domain-containing protein n=1 Tax=Colletotrichum spaethianum TaxID=700344 RepID=A0AA37UNL7_9PEZI|nr:uncharacterized protein ColSpa_08931 [Colletotrichum spaethianum]GKT48750.1 hypothetical protein ColSpa_08931 [Colletotrichum spaethianum]